MRFEKKDIALAIPATLLAVAGLGPDDPWVVGPCLFLSWITFIVICAIHEGQRKTRIILGIVITLALSGVGYRRFNSIYRAPKREPQVDTASKEHPSQPTSKEPPLEESKKEPPKIENPLIKGSLRTFSQRPYDLTGPRREKFIKLVSKPQSEPRDTLRIACIRWSEDSCIAAGKFLLAFSEAGWSIEDWKVFREEPSLPMEGVAIVSHLSDADYKKWQALTSSNKGVWWRVDASQQTISRALDALHIPRNFSSDQSLPSGTIGVYFGPEPRK